MVLALECDDVVTEHSDRGREVDIRLKPMNKGNLVVQQSSYKL